MLPAVMVGVWNARSDKALHDERRWILERPKRSGSAAHQRPDLGEILTDGVIGSLQACARWLKGELDGRAKNI